MHPAFYEQVFSVQGGHWWGGSGGSLSFDLLKKCGLKAERRHFDPGCGSGQRLWLLEQLRPSLTVGADVSPIALSYAGKACARCQLVRQDVNQPLFFPERSDVRELS
jgi:trans-aconitate methyltransferase